MTATCPLCGEQEVVGMCEYSWDHPQHYDGTSEYLLACSHRIGRWTGNLLNDGEYEPARARFEREGEE